MLGETGLLHNCPGNPVLLSQPFEIFFTEPLKVLLVRDLFRPLHRKRWKHGTCSLVFNQIRQPAALGTSAKSILIFSGSFHMSRVDRKESVALSIFANPVKRLRPLVMRLR